MVILIGIVVFILICVLFLDREKRENGESYLWLDKIGKKKGADVMRDNADMVNSKIRGKYSGSNYDKYHIRKAIGQIQSDQNNYGE